MLHYHQTGVTLTLEFSDASDCHSFQEGLLELLTHVAETTDASPVGGMPLNSLTLLLRGMMLSETQHQQAARKLKAA